jgi:hypothetical protein
MRSVVEISGVSLKGTVGVAKRRRRGYTGPSVRRMTPVNISEWMNGLTHRDGPPV